MNAGAEGGTCPFCGGEITHHAASNRLGTQEAFWESCPGCGAVKPDGGEWTRRDQPETQRGGGR